LTSAPASSVLELRRVTKRFGQTIALSDIDLSLEAGRVDALVGENGAGKSTLVNVMTGVHAPDRGELHLEGRPLRLRSPQDAEAHGIAAAHQEISLLLGRTVAENLLLGREPVRWGLIQWKEMNDRAHAELARLGLDLDPRTTLRSLSLAVRQMIAIARASMVATKVMILDEPTSALGAREVDLLGGVVERAKARGVAIVYISHRFDEIDSLCDRVTVLRDGSLVQTRPVAGLDRVELVGMMLGRRPADALAARERSIPSARPSEPPVLAVENLRRGNFLRGVELTVHRGEIIGLAGLLGSGRSETARAIFGETPPDSGSLRIDGQPYRPSSPRDAIARGMGFLSEDRKRDGIVPDWSVRENLTLAMLPVLAKFGIVSRSRQNAIVDRYIAALRIKTADPDQPIRELSGGNQQKVLLARCLTLEPTLLIVDEPTRGIDVGAKAEILDLFAKLVADGLAMLMISSEIEELLEHATRIVVLSAGRTVAELAGSNIQETAVMQAMAGQGSVAP
jgi:monosaccharide-transporting ATPase